MRVELVVALPGTATCMAVELPAGATVADAVALSGILDRHPQIRWPESPVGVFGRRVTPGTELADGDRIEIYRPLRVAPMERRRRRAQS